MRIRAGVIALMIGGTSIAFGEPPKGHRIRMVAFGANQPAGTRRYHIVLLRDVIGYLRRYLRDHWSIAHYADFKDPAFSFLMMLEKAGAPVNVAADMAGGS